MVIRITAVRKANYPDLSQMYENPVSEPCRIKVGDVFLSYDGRKPNGICDSAWTTIEPFATELARGGGNFYDGWMKNPRSAMISCNDGFRPVSFLIEVAE